MSSRTKQYFLIPKKDTSSIILGPFDSKKAARSVIPLYAGALKEPYHLVKVVKNALRSGQEKTCVAS